MLDVAHPKMGYNKMGYNKIKYNLSEPAPVKTIANSCFRFSFGDETLMEDIYIYITLRVYVPI